MVDVVHAIGEPVYLLGHSYGAHCALLAASQQPNMVRKLVLYEPAWPTAVPPDALAALETLAAVDAWDQFAFAFFANLLHVPTGELDVLRASDLWARISAVCGNDRGIPDGSRREGAIFTRSRLSCG